MDCRKIAQPQQGKGTVKKQQGYIQRLHGELRHDGASKPLSERHRQRMIERMTWKGA